MFDAQLRICWGGGPIARLQPSGDILAPNTKCRVVIEFAPSALGERQGTLTVQHSTGVQFADDQAARYGDFDEIAVVGLIEGEWPERPMR